MWSSALGKHIRAVSSGPSSLALALGYFSMSQVVSWSGHNEQSLLPGAQRRSCKEQTCMRLEKEIPFRNNLRKTFKKWKKLPNGGLHTQHSVFICSKLILVICSLWFERPANLEPFFLVIRGPVLWPDVIATWTTTAALGDWSRVLRLNFPEKEHSALAWVTLSVQS